MTTDDPVLERVQTIINEIAGPERTPDDAGPATPLGDSGYWFDSLDMLEVILACEREFGAVFEAGTDLTADTLLSARGLAGLIRKRTPA
jgi:acyl carrier protein